MAGYLDEDQKFTNYLLKTIEPHFDEKETYTLIDFGCAFATKTRRIKEYFKIGLFIGIETNLWIVYYGFKKRNPSNEFYIRRKISSAIKIHSDLNKNNPTIFISNSSMMYLSSDEKQNVFNLIPSGSLIVITEPEKYFSLDVLEKVNLKILEYSSIPKEIYDPGMGAKLLLAKN